MASKQKQIVWTDEAIEEYRKTADYLYESWSAALAERFTDSVSELLDRLQTMPRLGQQLDWLPGVRQIMVPPYAKIYYSIAGEFIIILNLKDTRRRSE